MTIRVLIVDDSPIVCQMLSNYIRPEIDIEVIGMVHSGAEAIKAAAELQPDVLTIGLQMPDMSGIEALKQIMTHTPTSIIVISGASRRAADSTFEAITHGAIDFVFKYVPGIETTPEMLRNEIISKIKLANRIQVVRSSKRVAIGGDQAQLTAPFSHLEIGFPSKLIVIGASSGGPAALKEFLGEIPADFSGSIVIVQHMPPSFTRVLAHQLNNQLERSVRESRPRDILRPGEVLIAPGDFHLIYHSNFEVRLNRTEKILGNRPSIDLAMRSAAQIYGKRVSGVLLTGMGDDGVVGLGAIQARGGQTFAQDLESCLAAGMPRRAVEKKVADFVLPPAEIAKRIGDWT